MRSSLCARCLPLALALAAILLIAAGPAPAARKVPLSVELVTEPNFPIAGSQQWYRLFSELGVSGLRIRSAKGNEKAQIEQVGTKSQPSYRVTGILTADNLLNLPGGKFTARDSGKLRKWLDNLSDQGAEGVTEPKMAFGLVSGQLKRFHDDLKKSVAFSTKDVPLGPAVDKVARQLEFPLTLDPGAAPAMAEVVVADELQGISRGTALAAMLRPAGLAFEPQRESGGKMQYRVRKAAAGRQGWPIGWKPGEPAQKVLPQRFDFLNVEFEDVALTEVLQAVEGRLKAPFLFDRGALALYKIDPAKVAVNLPPKRMSYSLVLQKVLFQARLRPELRVDEADKPFFWITTVKPVP